MKYSGFLLYQLLCLSVLTHSQEPTVQNVRVYVYFPVRGGSNVTALVVWDRLSAVEAGGGVDNYTVRVFNVISGEEVTGLTQNGDARTQYSIEIRENGARAQNTFNLLQYPLVVDTIYRVEVFASNSSGAGEPSQSVNFSTAAASPPHQVFGVSMSGGEVIGDGTTPTLDVSPPLTVNTINRTVYWYHGNQSVLMQQPLDGGDPELVGQPLAGVTVLAVAYDWVGEMVYFIARRDAAGGTLGLWRVVVVNPAGLELVFEDEDTTLSVETEVQLAVDPFRGFVYWSLQNGSAIALQQLDLRDPTSSETLTTTLQLASFSLTSALTLDPANGRLWVCNADTGDLLSCDPASPNVNCTVEVNASDLMDEGALNATAGDAGLPATSIALDESRIYWTRDGTPGIFFVSRNATTDLMMISGADVSTVITLSPGQQPLPSIGCLAPEPVARFMRPKVSLVNATNLTLTVSWTTPTLRSSCSNEVFSVAPFKYDLLAATGTTAGDTVPGYPQSTFDTTYVLTGLQPYIEYCIELRAENQYSVRRSTSDDGYGSAVRLTTSEGVPDPPSNVQGPLVYGTRNIHLSWDEPITTVDIISTLRGPPENLRYLVRVNGNYTITIDTNNVNLTASDQLQPGMLYSIEVFVSNQVLVSPAVVVNATTWPLPPRPVVTETSNTSITVVVMLTDVHEPIEEIYIKVIPIPSVAAGSRMTSTQTVEIPNTLNFTIQGLEANTQYSIVAVGRYQSVSGFTDGLEEVPGQSIMTQTRESLCPVLSAPTNGQVSHPNTTVGSMATYSCNTGFTISSGDITRTCQNDSTWDGMAAVCSESDSALHKAAVIGIAVGVLAALVVLLACLILCVWCVSNKHKKRRERHLSNAYGPDLQLSNLRENYQHKHAVNPNYIWSRDDYVCTDEDLELLHKFPRQCLELETFIDRGEFGEVYQGTATDILGPDTGPTPVAVKTFRTGTTVDEQKKFLSEASLMSNFNHPNIVKVLGVCVDNDPVYIIMELMPAGDLLHFLRDARREHGPALLTLTEQMQIVLDVSQGCRYLEQQHFIHRDIAARNCLVSSKGADRVVKIGDFGLAKDLYSSDYYRVEGQRKVPVRWMAPEALLQGVFTMESDVWSFGVLLWEIMTLGNQPYPSRNNEEALQFVTGGGRLEQPDNCPEQIYSLMQNCWKKYSSERPKFQEIVTTINNFLDHLSKCSDSDSDTGNDTMQRKGSTRRSARSASRTSSIRSGVMNLVRAGSTKLRNSLRRTENPHIRAVGSENLIASDDGEFSESGQSTSNLDTKL